MAIRVYKPTTAGRRNASVSDFSELTRSTPEKSLVRKLSKTGGRNSYGRMTSRHRGGGHKRQYRLIDFKRWDKDGVPAKVAHIEYDPNRSARIALLHYADGEKRYIIAPEGIKQGDVIETVGLGDTDIVSRNMAQHLDAVHPEKRQFADILFEVLLGPCFVGRLGPRRRMQFMPPDRILGSR